MYCRNCGQELRDSGPYCSKCGNKVRATEPPAVTDLSQEKMKPNKTKRNAVIISSVCGVCLFAAIFFIFRDSDDRLDVDISPPSGNTSIASTTSRENESPAVDSADERLDLTPIYRDTLVNIVQDPNQPDISGIPFDIETGLVIPGAYTPMMPMIKWSAYPNEVKYANNNSHITVVPCEIHASTLEDTGMRTELWFADIGVESVFNLNHLSEMIENNQFEILKEEYGGEYTFTRLESVTEKDREKIIMEIKTRGQTERADFLWDRVGEWYDFFWYAGETPTSRMITGVNFTVTTPAGIFENCIEVYTTFHHTKTYYAPYIGEVLVMSLDNDGVNNKELHSPRNVLLYYEVFL